MEACVQPSTGSKNFIGRRFEAGPKRTRLRDSLMSREDCRDSTRSRRRSARALGLWVAYGHYYGGKRIDDGTNI